MSKYDNMSIKDLCRPLSAKVEPEYNTSWGDVPCGSAANYVSSTNSKNARRAQAVSMKNALQIRMKRAAALAAKKKKRK